MTKPLTPEQVANHYGVTIDTVYDWIGIGKLEAINIAIGKKKPHYRITVRAMRQMERKNSTATEKTTKPRRRTAAPKQYV